jgi:hypothetical protein
MLVNNKMSDIYKYDISATIPDCCLKNRKVTFRIETGDSGADKANRTVNPPLLQTILSTQHIVKSVY